MPTHIFEPRLMISGRKSQMCKHCGEFRTHPNHPKRKQIRTKKKDGGK